MNDNELTFTFNLWATVECLVEDRDGNVLELDMDQSTPFDPAAKLTSQEASTWSEALANLATVTYYYSASQYNDLVELAGNPAHNKNVMDWLALQHAIRFASKQQAWPRRLAGKLARWLSQIAKE